LNVAPSSVSLKSATDSFTDSAAGSFDAVDAYSRTSSRSSSNRLKSALQT
jgi:hypothetical protein